VCRIDGGEIVFHQHEGVEAELCESVEESTSHNVDVELVADKGEI